MSCPAMLEEYEDATPAMSVTQIGIISKGCDGSDEYLLVKSNEGDITPEQVHDELMPRYYHPGNGHGGYFCDTILIQPVEHSTSSAIVIVQHRYDV